MLFLLPINEQLSWRRLPVVTITLVVLIIAIFVFFQLDDQSAREQAKQHYFESGLSKIELPQYVRFVRRHMHINAYYNLIEGLRNGVIQQDNLYWAQRSDPIFQNELKRGKVIKENHHQYLQWRQLRREYNYLLAKDQAYLYGFKTSEPSFVDAVSSFFLHGNWHHLVGNILFLLFIGINLEIFVSSFVFVSSIIVIQAVSICVYSFVFPFSSIPLLGASGVIAGLIGMHAVILGTKKINYFVNILFYFNTVKLPGLMVVPIWLIWEGVDYFLHPLSVKSYASHFSGLFAGILIGIMIYRSKNTEFSGESGIETSYKDFQSRFDEAIDRMAELNFPVARKKLLELMADYPNNHEVLFQLFNVTKMDPSSEDYHSVVTSIFTLKDNSKSTVSMMNIVFKNYVKRAEPSIRFDVKVFLTLHQRFRKYGYLDDAEKILKVLVQHNKFGKLDEVLAREQLMLARSFANKQDSLKAKRTLDWCLDLYPQTASAKEARNLLINTG